MPVPELNSTLDKYLNLVRPIVNDEQYEKTKKIVTEFRAEAGIGEKLQKLLIEFAESKDNWVSSEKLNFQLDFSGLL